MEDNGKKKRSTYFKISVYVFIVGALLLLFNRLLDSMGDLLDWLSAAWSTTLTTLLPFFIAIVLAYLFRPVVEKMMNLIERLEPKKNAKHMLAFRQRLVKRRRFACACALYIVFVAVIVLVLAYMLPTTIQNIAELVQNMPEYATKLLTWIDENVMSNENIPEEVLNAIDETIDNVNTSLTGILSKVVSMMPTLFKRVYDASSMSLNIVLAIVLSFYLVCDDGRMFAGLRKWMTVKMGPKHSKRFFQFTQDLDFMFSKYLVGRLLESLIVGALCFVVMLALGLPYNMLLSVFYALTNIIPYIGPVIGLIPIACLALFKSPATALLVAVLLTLIQCYDAWMLSPKVLGDSMGLNPFWIIFALVIGGALFGVVGLLLSTPVMGVLMRMIERSVERINESEQSEGDKAESQ